MTLKLGHTTSIVISSAALAKEILQKHDAVFSNRTIFDALRAHQHHQAGVGWMPVSTPTWRYLRKICKLQIFASQKLDTNQHLRQRKVEQLVADVHRSCCVGEAGIRRSTTILFGELMNLFDRVIDKRLELRKMNDYVSTNDLLDTLLDIEEDNKEQLDRNLLNHLLLVVTLIVISS
ncbi:Cytochrome P450 [Corchorus olitorius]|uniref:Cytochrome P450 n=1 Tax=Corchorus olitorius TaxID=93759 RepID=A0A1R3K7X0_9ROSI|nr:Cytochrome P450 [Corchorus olitorius]